MILVGIRFSTTDVNNEQKLVFIFDKGHKYTFSYVPFLTHRYIFYVIQYVKFKNYNVKNSVHNGSF